MAEMSQFCQMSTLKRYMYHQEIRIGLTNFPYVMRASCRIERGYNESVVTGENHYSSSTIDAERLYMYTIETRL